MPKLDAFAAFAVRVSEKNIFFLRLLLDGATLTFSAQKLSKTNENRVDSSTKLFVSLITYNLSASNLTCISEVIMYCFNIFRRTTADQTLFDS